MTASVCRGLPCDGGEVSGEARRKRKRLPLSPADGHGLRN